MQQFKEARHGGKKAEVRTGCQSGTKEGPYNQKPDFRYRRRDLERVREEEAQKGCQACAEADKQEVIW
jgi:hypothetical protein